MAKEVRNTIRLGIFVALGLVLFTIGVYFIGNQQNLFRPRFRISTLVGNASGLQVGNNVRYAGIVVGSVEDIVFINDTTLRVGMVLDAKVKNIIRKNAVASIGMDGLVGNVIVNISPGPGNQTPVKDGEIIASASRLDPNAMLETLGSTGNNAAAISQKLLEITSKLNEGQGTLPLLLRDSLMAENFISSMQQLQIATRNIMLMSEQLKLSAEGVSKGKGTLGYMLNDQTLPHQLESLTARLDSLLIVQTEPLVADLKKSGENLAASSAELKTAVESLNRGDGLAATVLKDTFAANNLLEILENVNEGTARFNENMEALKHNFLFRRYFKKQEKEKRKMEESRKEKEDVTVENDAVLFN